MKFDLRVLVIVGDKGVERRVEFLHHVPPVLLCRLPLNLGRRQSSGGPIPAPLPGLLHGYTLQLVVPSNERRSHTLERLYVLCVCGLDADESCCANGRITYKLEPSWKRTKTAIKGGSDWYYGEVGDDDIVGKTRRSSSSMSLPQVAAAFSSAPVAIRSAVKLESEYCCLHGTLFIGWITVTLSYT